MNPSEILTAAAEAKPELIEKVAMALFALEHIDPDFASELAGDIKSITEHTVEKTAADMSGGLKAFTAAAGGALAVGLAGAVATDLYDAAKRGLTKGLNYKRILDANPDLKKNYDGKDLKNAYGTFHRYAPEFTADPNLGGQILRAMAEIPANQKALVDDLLKARSNLRTSKEKQFKLGPTTVFVPSAVADDSADKNVERQLWLNRKTEEMRAQMKSQADAKQVIFGMLNEKKKS
jgi:hypothetical protein